MIFRVCALALGGLLVGLLVGLMAPMPLSGEQLHQISVFLGTGEFEKPGRYDQHYEEEHGAQN